MTNAKGHEGGDERGEGGIKALGLDIPLRHHRLHHHPHLPFRNKYVLSQDAYQQQMSSVAAGQHTELGAVADPTAHPLHTLHTVVAVVVGSKDPAARAYVNNTTLLVDPRAHTYAPHPHLPSLPYHTHLVVEPVRVHLPRTILDSNACMIVVGEGRLVQRVRLCRQGTPYSRNRIRHNAQHGQNRFESGCNHAEMGDTGGMHHMSALVGNPEHCTHSTDNPT